MNALLHESLEIRVWLTTFIIILATPASFEYLSLLIYYPIYPFCAIHSYRGCRLQMQPRYAVQRYSKHAVAVTDFMAWAF